MTTADNRWIVSPPFDAFWFLLTPLFCAALVLPLRLRFDSLTILVFVMGLSSFGHHLPGFLRAYGDDELFRRFRTRFLLAPLVVYATFVAFALKEMQGMLLLLMVWSVWHVGMQHFGFLRIYDAKRGIHDRLGARLDWVVSIAWFAAIVLNSPTYGHVLVERMFAAGWTWLTPGAFEAVSKGVLGVAVLASAGYAAHVGLRLSRGLPVSWVKLTLLVVTLVFLQLVWGSLGDIYLGLATWEVFHDLQYFALTWVYNRRLVDEGLSRSRVMRAFFSPRRVLLYAVAIPAYGSLNLLVLTTEGTRAFPYLMAFVFTSTFLHYYFDGFIWKVRQSRTRQGLALDPTGSRATPTTGSAPWSRRLAHAAWFLAPIGAVAAAETLGPEREQLDYFERIAEIVPHDPLAFANLARAREEAGDSEGAAAAYRRALEVDPESAVALDGLAVLEDLAGRPRDAEALWERALEADPIHHVALANYATFLFRRGRVDEARTVDERATLVAGRRAGALLGAAGHAPTEVATPDVDDQALAATARLGQVHARLEAGDLEGAREELAACTGAEPAKLAYARGRLALAGGELEAAVAELERAARDLADVPPVRESLANAYEASGRFSDAADQRTVLLELVVERPPALVQGLVRTLLYADRAAEAVPHLRSLAEGARDPSYDLMLAEILATHPDAAVRDGAEALTRAERVAAALGPGDPAGFHVLALAAAETGDVERAIEATTRALELAAAAGRSDVLPKLQAQLEDLRAGRPLRTSPSADDR